MDIWARTWRKNRLEQIRRRKGEGAHDKGLVVGKLWNVEVWLQPGRHKREA